LRTTLNASIDTFEISYMDLKLSNQLIDEHVFANTSTLETTGRLDGIDANVFRPFWRRMRHIILNLYNFRELVHTNTEWMYYINEHMCVDDDTAAAVNLSDPKSVACHSGNMTVLELRDLLYDYEFPERDFCRFQHFPHRRLVYARLISDWSLPCSCTLLYLMRYWRSYAHAETLKTKAVEQCLNSERFDAMLVECRFEERLAKCSQFENLKFEKCGERQSNKCDNQNDGINKTKPSESKNAAECDNDSSVLTVVQTLIQVRNGSGGGSGAVKSIAPTLLDLIKSVASIQNCIKC
jgi:hypothetical protein